MGSKGQDLVGDSLINFLTLSSVTGLKVLKAGGTDSGGLSSLLLLMCDVSCLATTRSTILTGNKDQILDDSS